MLTQSPLIEDLIEALTQLPGVGPRTAQRMTYSLLERNRQNGMNLAHVMQEAMHKIGNCSECRTFSETDRCVICTNETRKNGQLCIVESPSNIIAIEQAGVYKGRYFVLMGHLSPIDGIGPEALQLDRLDTILQTSGIQELVLATNSTVEGEATAHYIKKMAERYKILVTKLAQGIPIGSELEYIDSTTLVQAFSSRKPLKDIILTEKNN